MNMPEMASWNPIAAADTFLKEKERRQSNLTTGTAKTIHQPYFKGIFFGAKEEDSELNAGEAMPAALNFDF